MLTRFFYTLSVILLLPWALLHLWQRGRKQPEYLHHVRERFGRYPARTDDAPVIWIHAVSVGETRAAEPLIQALRRQYPTHRILITHMTPTGRATTSPLLDTCERRYLPYDTPWAVRRFLNHYSPVIGLIMETELWPNLIAIGRKRGIPLLLVNARLSARSARRYRRLRQITEDALQGLTAIAAQNKPDADGLRSLGARNVEIFGNVKFDIDVLPQSQALASQWRTAIGGRPVLLLASTREGEEALLLAAWRKTLANEPVFKDALLVIVPRHPQRFAEVAQLARTFTDRVALRSEHLPSADTQIWIGDSMGEMAAYYSLADIAFIGGSLLDFGSQNLIEACAVGAPVLLGPSVYNFAQAAADALASGGAEQHAAADTLLVAAARLLKEPQQREAMSEAGKAFAAKHRGATARTLALITRVMPR